MVIMLQQYIRTAYTPRAGLLKPQARETSVFRARLAIQWKQASQGNRWCFALRGRSVMAALIDWVAGVDRRLNRVV